MTEAEAVPAAEADVASIGRQAGRGFRWSLLGNIVNKFGSFALGLVLARLLAPSDFGVYAIAFSATQLVMNINDVGLIAATVQWRGKLEEMAATATTLTIAFSAAIYAAFYFAAPWYTSLSNIPQATPVVRVLTLVILIDGVAGVRAAVLMRTFRQDQLIRANMVGLVANAGVAIAMAANGGGAMSFAAGQVVGSLVTSVLVVIAAKQPWQFALDLAVARRLLAFGVPLAMSLGVEAILFGADSMIVGRVLGVTALGYYLLAYNVAGWAQSVIGSAIRYVSIAGFSRLSEQDSQTLSAGVQRTVPILFTGLVPIAVLTAAMAYPIVGLLYGGAWEASAPVLRLLVVLTVVRMLVAISLDILMSAGATRSALFVNASWAIALIPSLWFGAHLWGLRGAATGHIVAGLLVAIPVTIFALHRVHVDLAPIAPKLVRPLLAGAVAGTVAYLIVQVTHELPIVQILLAGTAGVVLYAAIAIPPEQLRQVPDLVRQRLGGQRKAAAHAAD